MREGEEEEEGKEGRKVGGEGGRGDQYSTLQESLFTNPYSDRVAFCVSSVSHVNWPFTTDTASSSAGERATVSILYASNVIFNFLVCLCVLSACLSVCLFVCLFGCVFISLCVCPSVCLFICVFVHLCPLTSGMLRSPQHCGGVQFLILQKTPQTLHGHTGLETKMPPIT